MVFRHEVAVLRRQVPLDRVLTEYVKHDNTTPPHRGLGLDLPVPAPAADARGGRIERTDILGTGRPLARCS